MKNNKLFQTNLLVSSILVVGFILTAFFNYRANYRASLENIEQVSSLTAEGIYYQLKAMLTKPVNISLTMSHDSLLVDHLLAELNIEKEQPEAAGEAVFKGMNFVITGSVEHFANRKELQELIESKGGKVTGSVTAKTAYLINNDAASNSSKNKKAKELGVPIISEEEFLRML